MKKKVFIIAGVAAVVFLSLFSRPIFLVVSMVLVAALILWLLVKLNCFIAESFYNAAKLKGFSEKRYFWLPFWLGIVGYLLVAALPDKSKE